MKHVQSWAALLLLFIFYVLVYSHSCLQGLDYAIMVPDSTALQHGHGAIES